MKIVNLATASPTQRSAAARMLNVAFAPIAWSTLHQARQEVSECCARGKICIGAVDEVGNLRGWVGARHNYARVWELHPMVVDAACRQQGIGRQLVAALEQRVAKRGGLTLMLGTDDERDQTSLANVDLYDAPWRHMRNVRNLRRHPMGFYLKCGYSIIGIVPDANGPGKPDILMARRISTDRVKGVSGE